MTALTVADVLQLQGGNRFSGSIVFSYLDQEAAVFMQHGEVVHAECGEARGEAVVGAILAWPTGNFQAHANVATFARTIDKRLDHLLLDSARHLDETRKATGEFASVAAAAPARAPSPPADPARPAPPAAAARARSVAGVNYAAVLRGGMALNDASPEASALASRCTFLLAMLANPLSKALGLGEVNRAALTTQAGDQLLLLHSKDAYLAVAIQPESSLADTETAIRRALAPRPGA